MAKDPAFLFYSNDFESRTKFFTHEQVGKLVRLMITQHQHGRLTLKQMEFVCNGTLESELMEKFDQDDKGLYYNDRLEDEISKRNKFTNSRRNNKEGKNQYSKEVTSEVKKRSLGRSHDLNLGGHMEIEEESAFVIKTVGNKKPKTLNKLSINNKTLSILFEESWSRYPKKLGKRKAFVHFKSAIKDESSYERFETALENFLSSKIVAGDSKYIPHGSTFFYNYLDYLEVDQAEQVPQKSDARKEMERIYYESSKRK